MSSSNRLHHCAACDEVFTAVPPLAPSMQCPHCGQSPFPEESTKHVSTVNSNSDSVMGVPGKDVADFVSMKRARRKKQRIYAVVFWIGLLGVGVGVALYNERETQNKLSVQEERENNEWLEQRMQSIAIGECGNVYTRYDQASTAEEASEYVCGGVQAVVKLKNSDVGKRVNELQKPYQLEESMFDDSGEHDRVLLVIRDANQKRFEAVFWMVDEQWRLDWDQHTRYNGRGFQSFLNYKTLGKEAYFDLYLRKKSVKGENGELLIVAYRPEMEISLRGVASPNIKVKKGSDLYSELVNEFNKHEQPRKAGDDSIELDGPGLIRARCSLVWKEGDDHSRELEITSVQQFHWMYYDPVKSK